LKETILFEAMLEISTLSDQGKIYCECGSGDWDIDIRGGTIDLICNICSGGSIFPPPPWKIWTPFPPVRKS
jgi:hypothetical protein